MKVYLVIDDVGYGASYEVVLVTTDPEKAEAKYKEIKTTHPYWDTQIEEHEVVV